MAIAHEQVTEELKQKFAEHGLEAELLLYEQQPPAQQHTRFGLGFMYTEADWLQTKNQITAAIQNVMLQNPLLIYWSWNVNAPLNMPAVVQFWHINVYAMNLAGVVIVDPEPVGGDGEHIK